MRLLILGGTVFLGRHLVEAALARGHDVTLFNRGRQNPDLFPEVEKLHGDRDRGLEALVGRQWDAVIDTSGYVPRLVRDSAELLAGATGHYTFISSISAYADLTVSGIDENAPTGTLASPTDEQVTGETYGPLKASCEQAAERAMPGRVLTLRPGLIVGPHDPSDRFTYWPVRMARGGEVLAPGRPERPVQIIDARDLAEWNMRMVEAGVTGIYNASGPATPLTMEAMLEGCRAAAGHPARLTWVSEPFLLEHAVGPWIELPLWVPETGPEPANRLLEVSVHRAVAAGLSFRPLADTAQATLAWATSRPPTPERHAGMAEEREAALLRAWHDAE